MRTQIQHGQQAAKYGLTESATVGKGRAPVRGAKSGDRKRASGGGALRRFSL